MKTRLVFLLFLGTLIALGVAGTTRIYGDGYIIQSNCECMKNQLNTIVELIRTYESNIEIRGLYRLPPQRDLWEGKYHRRIKELPALRTFFQISTVS